MLGDILGGKQKNKVLLDGSPQYLMVPSAAARVKASVPQAKFVIVVRVRHYVILILPEVKGYISHFNGF